MIMKDWKCSECSSSEGDEKELVKKVPSRLFRFWSLFKKNVAFDLPDLPETLCWKVETETGKINIMAVCHHCGKPLCQQHRILIVDDAFGVVEDELRTLLPTWWPQSVKLKANHRFRDLESKFLLWLANFHSDFNSLKQQAYHCKTCWQNYHSLSEYEKDTD